MRHLTYLDGPCSIAHTNTWVVQAAIMTYFGEGQVVAEVSLK